MIGKTAFLEAVRLFWLYIRSDSEAVISSNSKSDFSKQVAIFGNVNKQM